MIWGLAIGFGMMLVLEGIIPFLFPRQWREAFHRITQFSDGQIRFFGLTALCCGLIVLLLARMIF